MPSEVRFAVMKKMIESAGWKLDRTSSSHVIFDRPNARNIVVVLHHGKVKPVYVRQAKKIIEEDRNRPAV